MYHNAKKNFYKFWWSEELDCLKQPSIDSNRLWKAAGKPRHGPIFDNRQSHHMVYRNGDVISKLKRGKAADIAGLTTKHLLFSHPILQVCAVWF